MCLFLQEILLHSFVGSFLVQLKLCFVALVVYLPSQAVSVPGKLARGEPHLTQLWNWGTQTPLTIRENPGGDFAASSSSSTPTPPLYFCISGIPIWHLRVCG